jgi:hypothetical protein
MTLTFPVSVSFHKRSTLKYSSIAGSIGIGGIIMKFIVMIVHTHVHVCIFVVCFLLGNSAASEFYMPTFRNNLSVPCS